MKYIVAYNKPFSHEVHYANTIAEAKLLIEEIFTKEEWKDVMLFKVEEELSVHQLFDKSSPPLMTKVLQMMNK